MINTFRKFAGMMLFRRPAAAGLILLLTAFAAMAQPARQLHGLTVELVLDQKIYVADEDMNVKVRIINRSGETLSLGQGDEWVKFTIRGDNDTEVARTGDLSAAGPFTLESGMMATRAFNPAPYFDIRHPGRYKLYAAIQVPRWHESLDCKPVPFIVVEGTPVLGVAPIDFGLPPPPGSPNALPETRRYSLAEVSYEEEMRLYFRLSDGSGRTLRCYPAGRLLSFSAPETQIDKFNNLHLLWQTGAKDFTYEVFMPDGNLLLRETHVYTDKRPRLSTNENGNIIVAGGVRRFSPQDIPK